MRVRMCCHRAMPLLLPMETQHAIGAGDPSSFRSTVNEQACSHTCFFTRSELALPAARALPQSAHMFDRLHACMQGWRAAVLESCTIVDAKQAWRAWVLGMLFFPVR